MVKRFFIILQRNWTYELEYGLEVARMIFINLITIGIPAIVYRIPNMPKWVFWVFGVGPMFILWWFYVRYSSGRMIQIKNNKKYARTISKSQIPLLLEAYPKQALYTKVNGKYVKITSSDDVSKNEEIKLVCIGNKPIYELKKINGILNENKQQMSDPK